MQILDLSSYYVTFTIDFFFFLLKWQYDYVCMCAIFRKNHTKIENELEKAILIFFTVIE